MIQTFTREQMLAIWKRHMGIKASPLTTAMGDATETDRVLLEEIDSWYADVLAHAPSHLLPVDDVAGECETTLPDTDVMEVRLPQRAVRMVSVSLSSWQLAARCSVSPESDAALLQNNVYTRATADDPIVVEWPGLLRIYGVDEGETDGLMHAAPTVASLRAVVRPAEGTYAFDTSLLRHNYKPLRERKI